MTVEEDKQKSASIQFLRFSVPQNTIHLDMDIRTDHLKPVCIAHFLSKARLWNNFGELKPEYETEYYLATP